MATSSKPSKRTKAPRVKSHPMLREFTKTDLLEVQDFAVEYLAKIEALHPRRSSEAPGDYLERIGKLSVPDDAIVFASGFIEGLAAGVACDIDQLFPSLGYAKRQQRGARRASS